MQVRHIRWLAVLITLMILTGIVLPSTGASADVGPLAQPTLMPAPSVRPELGPPPTEPEEFRDPTRAVAPASVTSACAGNYIDVTDRAAVVALYNSDHEITEPDMGWTGNYATCNQGDLATDYRDAIEQRFNYFRSMAGVCPINFVSPHNEGTQIEAYYQSLNDYFSHDPSLDGECATTLGKDTIATYGSSNIFKGATGLRAIDGFIQDPGANNTKAGHRRWMLLPTTYEMGVGEAPGDSSHWPFNALYPFGTRYTSREARDMYVTWPPPGYVPYQVVFARWSFSYPDANFTNTTVVLTQNPGCTSAKTITVTRQNPGTGVGYGESSIVFIPSIDGYTSAGRGSHPQPSADEVYEVQINDVEIDGTLTDFTYNVIIIDPAATPPGAMTWTGTSGTDWATCENWSTGRAPLAMDSVTIPDTANDPVIDSTAHVQNLTIATGGHVTMNGGTLSIYGDWQEQGAGQFVGNGGTVAFKGTVLQTVTTHADSSLPAVEIGDGTAPTSVALGSEVDVKGNLTIKPSASLKANTWTLKVAGNWDDQNVGSGFIPGTGTVVFDGSTQTVTKLTSANLLAEDFSNWDDVCCYSSLPDGWVTEAGTFYQGDLLGGNNGTANRWRNEANGYLITKGFPMSPGVDYKLTYKVATRRNWSDGDDTLSPQTVSVLLGTGQAAAELTTVLSGPTEETATTLETRTVENITVTTAGIYYLGFLAQQTGDDYTAFDDISLSGVGNVTFNHVQVAAGTTLFNKDVKINGDLIVDKGATADLETHAVTVEGTVSNNGTLKQTQTVSASGTTEFFHIQNSAGTETQYQGVDVTPEGDMGVTTVEVRGNQLACTGTISDPLTGRCFAINPTSLQTATVKFWYTEAERNQQDASALTVSQYNGGLTPIGTNYTRSEAGATCTGAFCWVQADAIADYGLPFGIGSGQVVSRAFLSIDKAVATAHTPVEYGDALTYTIVLSNAGNADATGVVVTDTLPTHVIGTDVSETVTVTAGARVVFSVTATLSDSTPSGVVIENTASFTHSFGSGSDSASFRVEGTAANQPPNVPSTPTPADGATDVPLTQRLSWSGGDPDLGNVVTYTVALGTTATPTPVVTTTQTSYTPAGLTADTRYYWRVTATDGLTQSVSALWSFTTTAQPPPTYTLALHTVGSGTITVSDGQSTFTFIGPAPLSYISGTVINLTAYPATGWSFDAWSGDMTGGQNPVQVTMDENKDITATFISSGGHQIYLPLILRNYIATESVDTTPPTVTSVSPSNNATDVALDAAIVIDFSEAMKTRSVNVTSAPNVTFTPAWSNNDTRLTLTHADFAASTNYAVTLNAAQDVAGNNLSSLPYTWNFTTKSSTPSSVCLTAEEAELVRLVNEYRGQNGLASVPASKSLTEVAHWHVLDLHENNPDSGTDSRGLACNMHSWSDQRPDLWSAVCYTSDHYYASGMWDKPEEITEGVYYWTGYENAYGTSGQATAQAALDGWKSSPGHNAVILEEGIWDGKNWPAMGVGIYEHHAVLWFGDGTDPQGTVTQCP